MSLLEANMTYLESRMDSLSYSFGFLLTILRIFGIGKIESSKQIFYNILKRLQTLFVIIGAIYLFFLYFAKFPKKFNDKNIITTVIPHLDYFIVCGSFLILYIESLFAKRNLGTLFDKFDKVDSILSNDFKITFKYEESRKQAENCVAIIVVLLFVGIFLDTQNDLTYWLYACVFGINVCSKFLYLVVFSLYMGICWQILKRFENLRIYFENLSQLKILNIKVDQVSKVYITMFHIIQQANENFGIFQLSLTGELA